MNNGIAVGIVGCGRMGGERARRLLQLGVAVTVLVDESLERANLLAAQIPGAVVARSIDEVDLAGLAALFICTPPGARRDAVAAAARHRIALFVEKPIATTIEDATWMRDAIENAGIPSAVGYMNRYRGGVARARSFAAESDVLGITAQWTCKPYAVSWWREPTLSGGPVNEQATHLVDLCRYLGGEIDDVEATSVRRDDTIAALLKFRSGALGTLFYSCSAPVKSIGLQLFTRQGALQLDGWDFILRQNPYGLAPGKDLEPFTEEVRAFMGAVVTGDRSAIRCDFADAYETQLVMEKLSNAAQRARRTLVASA